MSHPDDDAFEDILPRAERFAAFVEALRAGDPAFAEASALYAPDMGEWQGAVYLLTGCDEVWRAVGAAVLGDRSMAPLIAEMQDPARAWSHSEGAIMEWAAHFWDVNRWPARLPWSFQEFYFQRWITSLHLRKTMPPALTTTASAGGT